MTMEMTKYEESNEWESKKELIKSTVCKGARDEELELFLYTCKRVGLDPLMRQIYSISRSGGRTIQAGIDGLRLIAERTGHYSPGKEPNFQYKPDGSILCCTAYVLKRTDKGEWHEIAATAYFDEYVVKSGPIWKDKPHCMISKCAEALALRRAFPADMAGIYADEEMGQLKPSQAREDGQEITITAIRASDGTVSVSTTERAPTIEAGAKLSDEEILRLAQEVSKRLSSSEKAKYNVETSPMFDYLKHCNSRCKSPIKDRVEAALSTSPEKFLTAFSDWQTKTCA